jgi:uncharacterized lipoprotein YehR (DUF1307 family)
MRIVEGMDMKKIAAAVLAVMLILSLAACASGEEPQKQSSTAQQSVTYSYTDVLTRTVELGIESEGNFNSILETMNTQKTNL